MGGWLGRQCGPTLPLSGGRVARSGPSSSTSICPASVAMSEQQHPSGDPESSRWAFQQRGLALRGGRGQQEPSRAEWPKTLCLPSLCGR